MTDNFQKDMSDVLFNIDDYIHVTKGNWIENELQAVERGLDRDPKLIKMTRDVLQIFNGDEEKLVETMQSLERLQSGKPLTPIMGLDDEWTLYCVYPYVSGLSCRVYYCNRMPSLLKYCIFDGKKECIKYSDVNRVWVYRRSYPYDPCRSKRITQLIDSICSIEMPYYPATDPIKVFVYEHTIGDIPSRFYDDAFIYDTLEIRWVDPISIIEGPGLARYYKVDQCGKLVALSKPEYEERLQIA